jgi:hypothetical protein
MTLACAISDHPVNCKSSYKFQRRAYIAVPATINETTVATSRKISSLSKLSSWVHERSAGKND